MTSFSYGVFKHVKMTRNRNINIVSGEVICKLRVQTLNAILQRNRLNSQRKDVAQL